MKARIKKTSEIVTLKNLYADGTAIDTNGRYCRQGDISEFIEESNHSIDWEQRRYELAKDFMSAMIASPTYKYCKALEYDVNKPLREHQDGLAKNAIIYTDRLIAELRKPNPDDEFSSIVEQAPNLFKALKEIAETDTNLDILGWSGKIKTIARDAINRCKKGGKE